jgi:hypothetical protein
MVCITAGATEAHISELINTMHGSLTGVVSFFTTTTASMVLRHILSAAPQVRVTNLVTDSAYEVFLSILHGAIIRSMSLFRTGHAEFGLGVAADTVRKG